MGIVTDVVSKFNFDVVKNESSISSVSSGSNISSNTGNAINPSPSNMETLDLSIPDEVSNASWTKSQYDQMVSDQEQKYEENIVMLDNILKENQDKINKLEELEVELGIVSAEDEMQRQYQQVDAQITNMIIMDMDSCPTNRLELLGIGQEDFRKYTQEQLIELYKSKIPEVKDMYDDVMTGYDEIIRSQTEYSSYSQLKDEIDNTNNDIKNLQTALKTLNNQKKQLKYEYMVNLEGYQSFHTSEVVSEIEISKCLTTGDMDVEFSYQKYCEEYGNISPLSFMRLSSEKYSQYHVNGIAEEEKLSNLLEASKYNENVGKMYEYIYQTEGIEAASKYLEASEDSVNSILGQVRASKFLESLSAEDDIEDVVGNHLRTIGKGLGDGLGSFVEGIENIFISSDVYSANEYEAMYIMQALQEKGYGLSFNYQISKGIGNMLPSIALSSVASPLGSITLGLSSGGNSYHSALVEGYDKPQAIIYGVMAGSSDALLERLCGAIPGISKVDESTSFMMRMVREGGQEFVQELLVGGIYDSIILGKEVDLGDLSVNAAQSFIAGAITAGILNTPGKVIQCVIGGKHIEVNAEDIQNIIHQIDQGTDPVEAMKLELQVVNSSENATLDSQIDIENNVSSPHDVSTSHMNPDILNKINEMMVDSDTCEKEIVVIQKYTESDIPNNYHSVEEYKKDFVDHLIASNKINDVSPYNMFLMAKDATMFSVLVGTDKLNNLYIKNLEHLGDSLCLLELVRYD